MSHVTTFGDLEWVFAHQPRYDKLGEKDIYECQLLLSKEDAEVLSKLAQEAMEEELLPKDRKGTCFVPIKADEDRGVWKVRFKKSAITRKGAEAGPIPVVDLNKSPIAAAVGNGSVGRVRFNIIPWVKNKDHGVMFYPLAIQIAELQEGKDSIDFPDDADAYGFRAPQRNLPVEGINDEVDDSLIPF